MALAKHCSQREELERNSISYSLDFSNSRRTTFMVNIYKAAAEPLHADNQIALTFSFTSLLDPT